MRIIKLSTLILPLLFISCGEDGPSTPGDNFNRKEVIENITDNLILPSYSDLNVELNEMQQALDTYVASATPSNKAALESAWLDAYLSWQDAALWNFGPAEDAGLLTAMNIYPTDTNQILANLQGSYDLNAISQFDAQGFPGLEYLLFSNAIDWTNPAVSTYFQDVLSRMKAKTETTISDWNTYRSDFVNAQGTDRGSAFGILFNHTFLPYLEVHNREAKFGIPGGQRTGTPAPEKVEGLYSRVNSKALALRAFEAYRRAWTGMSHVDHTAGASVLDYVTYMDQRNGTQLSGKLESELDDVQLAIEGLDNDFYSIAQTNPQQLNDVWAAYQVMVFTIKTEISSSLNVTISYVDSDGD
ncbi:imelysin family protein [Phaeocystidibacter luteus]|uniref:Imelysin family protein n=1 Tax=Phaeocystidibacter luteus TaxID=911197 RepID=A0A6N6RIV2_9FLAO|nr:imelysin family protein [Phaeocystidibacter luteus]KAB2805379.1 imelysin family protein [Phaeocystidibacter luteus]